MDKVDRGITSKSNCISGESKTSLSQADSIRFSKEEPLSERDNKVVNTMTMLLPETDYPIDLRTLKTDQLDQVIIDEKTSFNDNSSRSSVGKHQPKRHRARRVRHNYQRHPKPPYSYIALIAMAIRESPTGRMTLAEINEFLMSRFPFFRGTYTGWKNSIRHNLSLNDCFHKILRDPTRPWGKDNYWTLRETAEFAFTDGIFSRRRRRSSGMSENDSRLDGSNVPPLKMTEKNKNTDKDSRTNSNSFHIDNLLGIKDDTTNKVTTNAVDIPPPSPDGQLSSHDPEPAEATIIGSSTVDTRGIGLTTTTSQIGLPLNTQYINPAIARIPMMWQPCHTMQAPPVQLNPFMNRILDSETFLKYHSIQLKGMVNPAPQGPHNGSPLPMTSQFPQFYPHRMVPVDPTILASLYGLKIVPVYR